MKKLLQSEWHNSMRGWFGGALYNEMIDNPDIVVVTCDLGYGLFDRIRKDFPKRFYNVGAAEVAGAAICVGLALEGKIPIFYSITTFGLYRCFEVWRNYVNHESIPVKICLSGRDKDYAHDGFSHWSEDAEYFLEGFENIGLWWPQEKEQIPKIVKQVIESKTPEFLSLKR